MRLKKLPVFKMPSMQVRFLLLLVAILGLVLLALPIDERFLIPCPFHQLTGWDCPFCGSQRMVRELLHANWHSAFLHNPFVLCSLPIGCLGFVRYLCPNSQKLHTPFLNRLFSDNTLLLYWVLAVLWGILRNLFPLS